jgi:hypothetical protein
VSDAPPVDLTKFRAAIEERRRREAEEAAAKSATYPSEPGHDADLIPEAPYERSEQDRELDRVIDGISIVDAYTRWCGKSEVKVRGGQTEGIKVSCPVPGHADRNPSAWLNTEKGTWFCAACDRGGDSYDIAAFHFGVSDYKTGANFHELRRRMAGSLGYTFITPPGVSHPIPVAPVSEPDPPSEPESTGEPDGTAASVVSIAPPEDDDWEIEFPTLDWRALVEPHTFLDEYMQCTWMDDIPEEYHFWNGLLAVGLALGRDATLWDRRPIFGNLFVCLLGNTGDGKSRSFESLKDLLVKALPHRWDDPNSKGIRVVQSPASAEVLIHNFSKPVLDPTNPKVVSYYAPVRGLIDFNELSGLVGRTNRQGNVLKPTLMEFYDASGVISTSSMTTGTKEAWQPYASAFTTTQPRALKDLMKKSDVDSGFLNRWIFASGKPKQRLSLGGFKLDITPAVKPLQDIHGWVGFKKDITWDEDASKLLDEFFQRRVFPAQKIDDSGFLTRLDLTLKKLILLFTANQKLESVPKEMVEKAIAMFPYLIAAYELPAEHIGNSLAHEVQQELLRHIRRYTTSGKGITFRELGSCIKRKKFPPDLVHKMLKILADMGEIEAVTTNAGKVGRPTVRYKYVG